MHFLLVGPGALGCLLAAILSRVLPASGARLSLLDHSADRADFLNHQGILYDLQGKQLHIPVKATVAANSPVVGPVDVVILCVKSYDIPACLASCQPFLRQDTLVIFMQNGISHLDCRHLTGKATCAFGTTTEGATLLGRGQVRHAGSGITHFGFLWPAEKHAVSLLEKTAAYFAQGGLMVSITEDILARLWAKLFINTGINALTASLNCPNGALLSLPGVPERMKAAVREAEAVAKAYGIAVQGDPYGATVDVCQKTASNISSMLQDVRNKRRTEIDAINGAILAAGRKLGLSVPENLLLVNQIKAIEGDYLKEENSLKGL